MADGRPRKRPLAWAGTPSERRLQEANKRIELRRDIDLEIAVGLNLDFRLSQAEKDAIREACKPRVRR